MKIVLANQFKNEQRRLKEWLLYNKALGVTDFILVDDYSTDESVKIIKSIKGITVHILPSLTEKTGYSGSADTNVYAGISHLAQNIVKNYKQIHKYCLDVYGKNVYLGFFDVDEFIFYKDYGTKSLLSVIQENIKDKPVMCLGSLEVNSDMFSLSKDEWLTQQTTTAMSFESKFQGTRKDTVKSFQNLSYNNLSVFYKTSERLYGHHVHSGGVPPELCSFTPLETCAFLHYRMPIYHPEINKILCNTSYETVKQISTDAMKSENL